MGYQCFSCLKDSVYWQADFMFEEYGLEGNGVVHVLKCSNCGADIEYYCPIEEEKNEIDTGDR